MKKFIAALCASMRNSPFSPKNISDTGNPMNPLFGVAIANSATFEQSDGNFLAFA